MAHQKPKDFIPYKVKDLKTYGSTESFFEGSRNYKRVFIGKETDYIWAELSLYNKLFDEEDWHLKGAMQIYKKVRPGSEEVFFDLEETNFKKEPFGNIAISKPVPASVNILQVRHGWGNNAKGSFWKPGMYLWEAVIDGKVVKQADFFVIEGVQEKERENPYFEIQSARLYTNSATNSPETRIYYKIFDYDKTKYVYLDLQLKNLLYARKELFAHCLGLEVEKITSKTALPVELKFLFYSDVGILKAKIDKVIPFYLNEDIVNITVGWGADVPGNWSIGGYKIEVIFQDKVIAVIPFTIAEKGEISDATETVSILSPSHRPLQARSSQSKKFNGLEQALEELNELIGLEKVKERIHEYVNYVKYSQLRASKGLETNEKVNLHFAFLGNPGTGKTTVARKLGKIFKALGLLTKGEVVEVGRAELVAEYIGQTAPKVKELIEKNRGNILFIDEAYSLIRDPNDGKDFGREVLEVLIREMSEGPGNISIVMAGYPDEMNTLLDANPGLRSRLSGNVIYFSDYSVEELMEIAILTFEKKKLKITLEALQLIEKNIIKAYRNRDKYFGNARFVISLIDSAKLQLASRLSSRKDFEKISVEELSTITAKDVEAIFKEGKRKKSEIPVDESLLEITYSELREMVGLQDIKEKVNELISLVKFYKEIGKEVQEEFPLHSVFYGNPGTGKTTVARLMAKIFKALGILEKGHLVEADRSKLVAEYMGQTAVKTNKLIDQALGGVLFIDEAYSLYLGPQDTYGKEAISTLLKRMEDQRGEFIVIIAGYNDNIQEFLDSNPGLKSRFDHFFKFSDYSADELLDIAMLMFSKEDVYPDPAATAILKQYLEKLSKHKDKHFGNARTVRKIVDRIVKNQHLRLARLKSEERTEEMLKTVLPVDVEEFSENISEMDSIQKEAPSIGFKLQKGNS